MLPGGSVTDSNETMRSRPGLSYEAEWKRVDETPLQPDGLPGRFLSYFG